MEVPARGIKFRDDFGIGFGPLSDRTPAALDVHGHILRAQTLGEIGRKIVDGQAGERSLHGMPHA